jgi:hypothetical protein
LFPELNSVFKVYNFQTLDKSSEGVQALREADIENCYQALIILWAKSVPTDEVILKGTTLI